MAAITNYHRLGGIKQEEFILLTILEPGVCNQDIEPPLEALGERETVLCLF